MQKCVGFDGKYDVGANILKKTLSEKGKVTLGT
jgi:hypothetical protein